MVIGTFAYCGSGQDTLADGFCKYKDFIKFSLGDIIRDIAVDSNIEPNRKNLQIIRGKYDKLYGREYIPKKILEKIKFSGKNDVILTGIRTIEEYNFFKNNLNLILVFVYAEKNVRFQRMLKRSDIKDERNYKLLNKRMNKENDLFDYEKLQQVADIYFDFNMPLEDYINNEYNIIIKLYNKLLKF